MNIVSQNGSGQSCSIDGHIYGQVMTAVCDIGEMPTVGETARCVSSACARDINIRGQGIINPYICRINGSGVIVPDCICQWVARGCVGCSDCFHRGHCGYFGFHAVGKRLVAVIKIDIVCNGSVGRTGTNLHSNNEPVVSWADTGDVPFIVAGPVHLVATVNKYDSGGKGIVYPYISHTMARVVIINGVVEEHSRACDRMIHRLNQIKHRPYYVGDSGVITSVVSGERSRIIRFHYIRKVHIVGSGRKHTDSYGKRM